MVVSSHTVRVSRAPHDAGAKAFDDGKPRIIPSGYPTKDAAEWYRGWDKANLAAPVPGFPKICESLIHLEVPLSKTSA